MKIKRGRLKFVALLFYCSIIFYVAFVFCAATCKAEEPEADPLPETSHLVINEVYPYSELGESFIELYNPTTNILSLKECTLEDRNITENPTKKPSPITKQEYLDPGNFIFLQEKKDFNFVLNDDNDKILLKCTGNIIDVVDYSNSASSGLALISKNKSTSISRVPDGSDTSTIQDFSVSVPTPGAENIKFETVTESKEADVQESKTITKAREDENGEKVTVSGTVTVLPDTLSSQFFYIQDETAGLQIYSYYKNFPEMQIGDIIQVSGELSEVSGERRLKMDKDAVINIFSHSPPPLPKQVEIRDIGESLEGQYIKITGTVAETSGSQFIVQDNENHKIKVVIKSMTEIDKPKMRKGDQVEIAGIVSQYKDEYRILPTKQEDVKIIYQNTADVALAETGVSFFVCPLISFILLLSWNTFQKMKMRLRESQRKFFLGLLLETYLP